MMYILLHDVDGSVGWHAKGGTLLWQGSFTMFGDSTIEVRFCCNGSGILKSTYMWKIAADKYTGYDYAGREVELTKLMKLEYCDDCSTWHRI